MDEKKCRRRNTLQNIAIVLLTISAVFLFAKTQLNSLGTGLGLDSLVRSGAAAAESATQLTDLSAPVRLAVTNSYGRYGSLFLTTTDDAFSAPGTLLGAALGSAGDKTPCGEAAFRMALSREGIYCDFLSPLPLSVLAGLMGADYTGVGSARRLLLSAEEDGSAALYLWDGGSGWFRCTTAVARTELLELTAGYEPGSASFALDNQELSPDYGTLDPYSLFVTEAPSLPVLYAANPLSDTDALLSSLGFNPHTNYRYSESNGTEVVVEGDSSVRIRPDGTVLYQSGTSNLLQISAAGEVPTAGEAAVGVSSLLGSLTSSFSNSASLYLRKLTQNGRSTTLTFDYQAGGVPIRFSGGTAAAEVTLEGTSVSAFTLRFRQYDATEQTALLLPLRQAVAIAARYPGAELFIGYADSGEDTVSPDWLAD